MTPTFHPQIRMPFSYIIVPYESTKTLKWLHSIVPFAPATPTQSGKNTTRRLITWGSRPLHVAQRNGGWRF